MTHAKQVPFGELLRRWRRRFSVSQASFGSFLHPKVHASIVCFWEHDARLPPERYLKQILRITQIPADSLGVQEDRRP